MFAINYIETKISSTKMNDIEMLLAQCPDLDFCMAFGKNRHRLRNFFDNFRDLKDAKLATKIGDGQDTKVLEIEIEKKNPLRQNISLTYSVALKIPIHTTQSSAMQNEMALIPDINLLAHRFPNFLTIFGTFDIARELKVFTIQNLRKRSDTNTKTGIMMEYIRPEKLMMIDEILDDVNELFKKGRVRTLKSETKTENDLIRLTHELVCIFYQIYFSLSNSFLRHNDLHYNNILLYHNDKDKYITFCYHESDDENSTAFQFDSQFVPKIIDFGKATVAASVAVQRNDVADINYAIDCNTEIDSKKKLPFVNYDALSQQTYGKQISTNWTNFDPDNRENYLQMISTFFPRTEKKGEFNLETIIYFLEYYRTNPPKSISEFFDELHLMMQTLNPFSFPGMRKRGEMHVFPNKPFYFIEYIQIKAVNLDLAEVISYTSFDGKEFKIQLFEVFHIEEVDDNKLSICIASEEFTNTDFVLEFPDAQTKANMIAKINPYMFIKKGEAESIRVIGIDDTGIKYIDAKKNDKLIAFQDLSTILPNAEDNKLGLGMKGEERLTMYTFQSTAQRDFWLNGLEKQKERRNQAKQMERRDKPQQMERQDQLQENAPQDLKESSYHNKTSRSETPNIAAQIETLLGKVVVTTATKVENATEPKKKTFRSSFLSRLEKIRRGTSRFFRNSFNKTLHRKKYKKYADLVIDYNILLNSSLQLLLSSSEDLSHDIAVNRLIIRPKLSVLIDLHDKNLIVGNDSNIQENKENLDYLQKFWKDYQKRRQQTYADWDGLHSDMKSYPSLQNNIKDIIEIAFSKTYTLIETELREGFFKALFHQCQMLSTFLQKFFTVDEFDKHAPIFIEKLSTFFTPSEPVYTTGGGINSARTVKKRKRNHRKIPLRRVLKKIIF